MIKIGSNTEKTKEDFLKEDIKHRKKEYKREACLGKKKLGKVYKKNEFSRREING